VPASVARSSNSLTKDRSQRLRSLLSLLWPPALVATVFIAVGRLGFFPTDEGLVQAWSYRILHGQVPHRDFISPLPEGSGVLHLVDYLIPGPLFEVSRVIAMCEYVAYAIALAWLIAGTRPWRWRMVFVAGVIVSTLINLNTFPLMTWYTVDGLLLVAAGMVVVAAGVRRESLRLILLGFVIVGAAAVTKQSFIPAPAFAWLLMFDYLRKRGARRAVGVLVLTGAAAALPSLAFLGWIVLMGGLHAIRAQLLGGAFVYGYPLVQALSPRHDLATLGPIVLAAVVLTAGIERVRGMLALALRVALTALVIGVPLLSQLGAAGNQWGTRLLWVLIAYVTVRTIVNRSVDPIAVVIVGLAWMSSLSYGYPWPNFVMGSGALYVLHRTWSGFEPDTSLGMRWRLPLVPEVAALLVMAVTGVAFLAARDQDVYLDRSASQLTTSLGAVAPAFDGLQTNAATEAYLGQMVDCIKRFPAARVAILPENAAMYPALNLSNPFPIDWMWPDSMRGSEARIVATTDELNRDGDYLVLFQTLDEPQIVNGQSLTPANSDSQIAAFNDVPADIYQRLNGTRTTCGTFLVVYSPPKPA
jgi:hypothetical protein